MRNERPAMADQWLNQHPKDKKQTNGILTVLGAIAGLLVFIMVVNGLAGYEPSGWLVFWLLLDLFLLLCMAALTGLSRSHFQICPRCHHSAPKGYTVCGACGYRVTGATT